MGNGTINASISRYVPVRFTMIGRRDTGNAAKSAAARAVAAFLAFAFVALPIVVLAQTGAGAGVDVQSGAQQVASTAGLATTSLPTLVGNIIRIFLGLLGIIALLLVIYAGYLWMTAAGDDAKVAKAKKVLTNGVVGLIIILSAYAIVSFLFGGQNGGLLGGIGQGPGGGGAPCFGVTCSADHHGEALGNGIIQYHYPEPNQNDVPRNTKIAITFKKPLLPSSIFRNYDDKGTYDTADDRLCAPDCTVANHTESPVPANQPLELNTANFKIIPVSALATPAGGSFDDQFDARYAAALANTGAAAAVTSRVTAVAAAYVPGQQQTVVIKPLDPLGSATANMNYRVALRGGNAGIRVWSEGTGGAPRAENALDSSDADGGYYWMFTTNTTIDITPPQVSAVVPRPLPDPGSTAAILDRNQLLQIYFNEAVDPTSASGILGVGGGFTNMEIQAKCLPNRTCDAPWNGTDFATVPGALTIGNRYRTVEFTPSLRCENVSENTCGEPVFCLPKNVELRFAVKAASVGAGGPQATANDGVVDMVDNSLDGNRNGTSEGPATADAEFFPLNTPPSSVDGLRDSARAMFNVGNNIDLLPPAIIDTDPKSSVPGGIPTSDTAYPGGPSKFPVDLPIGVSWDKTLSITSLVTGGIGSADATVVLQSVECRKSAGAGGGADCPRDTEELPKPWFFTDLGDPIQVQGRDATRLSYVHRAFFTATDLGYTEEDQDPQIPRYVPLLRAKIRDTKQNCFYPSVGGAGYACSGTDATNTSCCNRLGQSSAICPP